MHGSSIPSRWENSVVMRRSTDLTGLLGFALNTFHWASMGSTPVAFSGTCLLMLSLMLVNLYLLVNLYWCLISMLTLLSVLISREKSPTSQYKPLPTSDLLVLICHVKRFLPRFACRLVRWQIPRMVSLPSMPQAKLGAAMISESWLGKDRHIIHVLPNQLISLQYKTVYR